MGEVLIMAVDQTEWSPGVYRDMSTAVGLRTVYQVLTTYGNADV